MEILTDEDHSESKFPIKKPLPPIGAGGDHLNEELIFSDSESDCDEPVQKQANDDEIDNKSTASNASASSVPKEHLGSGKSRPAVLRGFKRETPQDSKEESERSSTEPTSGRQSKSKSHKETMKRRAFDGREVTFITEDTQTDWDWLKEAEQSGKVRLLTPRHKKKSKHKKKRDSVASQSRSVSQGSLSMHDEDGILRTSSGKKEEAKAEGIPVVQEESKTESPYPINDEFGVPMLELSSDSDTSSDEEDYGGKKVQDDRTFMPSIGPPQILQYNRESEKKDIEVADPASRLPEESEVKAEGDEDLLDEHGKAQGMFGGTCEFCGHEVQPWPTVEQQHNLPPDQLYCCNQYREFVEFTIDAAIQMENEHKKKTKKINIASHAHYGSSKEDRKVAKERALQRMREKEMARKQQESAGFQQQSNFYSSSPPRSIFRHRQVLNLQTVQFKEMDESSRAESRITPSKSVLGFHKSKSSDSFTRSVLGSSKQRDKSAKILTFAELRSPESRSGLAVAQKMKTINYQLSSQKCLEEGWTIRAPSPLLPEDEDDTFIPEPLNIDLIKSGKLGLVEKYYEDGRKFMTMFPDGTGNIFYPSGNLAIAISSVVIAQFNYIIQADSEKSTVLAAFEPNGYATCYHPNGVVRLCMDQLGGVELDAFGARKRKWSWKDQHTHVHAPPFQPIHFGLNKYIGVRILSQDKMVVVFSAGDRSKRFNVGARLKLNHAENIPPPEIDESLLYLDEKKLKVETLLDKVATLLKFPKSPKIDKILPPLHVTSKALKTERLRRDRIEQLAAAEAKKNKQTSISVG